MDHQALAASILRLIGGVPNVGTASHCATRLRVVLKDPSRVDKVGLEALPAVKGTLLASEQFQIVLGQGVVNRVYEALAELIGAGTVMAGEEKDDAAMARCDFARRFLRSLWNVFSPVLPLIAACVLLAGVLWAAKSMHWMPEDSVLFQVPNMFVEAAFIFLPILLGFSAGREFKTNMFLAAALGGILVNSSVQHTLATAGTIQGYWDVFGHSIPRLGYQGSIVPVVVAVWAMSYIERGLRKVIPDVLDIILTPFLTLSVSGVLALGVIGPLSHLIGHEMSARVLAIVAHVGALSGS